MTQTLTLTKLEIGTQFLNKLWFPALKQPHISDHFCQAELQESLKQHLILRASFLRNTHPLWPICRRMANVCHCVCVNTSVTANMSFPRRIQKADPLWGSSAEIKCQEKRAAVWMESVGPQATLPSLWGATVLGGHNHSVSKHLSSQISTANPYSQTLFCHHTVHQRKTRMHQAQGRDWPGQYAGKQDTDCVSKTGELAGCLLHTNAVLSESHKDRW